MPRHWFHPAVSVVSDKIGQSIAVSNVEQAAQMLLAWDTGRPLWRKARDACLASLEGKLDPQEVQALFEAAAKESDKLARS